MNLLREEFCRWRVNVLFEAMQQLADVDVHSLAVVEVEVKPQIDELMIRS